MAGTSLALGHKDGRSCSVLWRSRSCLVTRCKFSHSMMTTPSASSKAHHTWSGIRLRLHGSRMKRITTTLWNPYSTRFRSEVFAFDDDYSFGIIQGAPHLVWYQAKAARLKNEEDYNYSVESIFDTFPWPQCPTASQIYSIAKYGREIRRIRTDAVSKVLGGLRGLYRTLAIPGGNPLKDAHAALDAAVLAAYGFSPKRDLLRQLLSLNHVVSAEIKKDRPVTAPGVPSLGLDVAKLVTTDCLGA